MPQQTCHFLNLPRELRDRVYQFVFEDRPKIPPTVERSKVVLHRSNSARPCIERPTGFVVPAITGSNEGYRLVCEAALCRVNRQIQNEFSDFLRSNDIDVVARVCNFDFQHVIAYINSLAPNQRTAFGVRRDGTARCTLRIEIDGSFDDRWRTQLYHWIEFVEKWIGLDGELMTAHRTIYKWPAEDRYDRELSALLPKLYSCYQTHPHGPGRLELDKLFYTLLGRHEAEFLLLDPTGRDMLHDLRSITT